MVKFVNCIYFKLDILISNYMDMFQFLATWTFIHARIVMHIFLAVQTHLRWVCDIGTLCSPNSPYISQGFLSEHNFLELLLKAAFLITENDT